MEQSVSWVCFCFSVWTVAHPSALYQHHLCAVSSVFTVAYTLKEREGAVHNKNHNAKSECLSGWGPRVVHTWHKPYPQVHLSPCMDITANPLWNPSLPSSLPVYCAPSLFLHVSLSIYLFLPQTISLSLHLLFPFLNLRGACVYSIFIILGGTVDRWDTCTITRAQHYLFQADRLKNTLSILSLTVSLFRKGDIIWRHLIFWTRSTIQTY